MSGLASFSGEEFVRHELVLPTIDYDNIAPVPALPEDPELRARFLGIIEKRARIIDATAPYKDAPVISGSQELTTLSGVRGTAEELAGHLTLAQYCGYAGRAGLMRLLDMHTDELARYEAQAKIEGILIASGPARVSVAFSPYSGYMAAATREGLVRKLGYQPLGVLSDTSAFDARYGIIGREQNIYRQIARQANQAG